MKKTTIRIINNNVPNNKKFLLLATIIIIQELPVAFSIIQSHALINNVAIRNELIKNMYGCLLYTGAFHLRFVLIFVPVILDIK